MVNAFLPVHEVQLSCTLDVAISIWMECWCRWSYPPTSKTFPRKCNIPFSLWTWKSYCLCTHVLLTKQNQLSPPMRGCTSNAQKYINLRVNWYNLLLNDTTNQTKQRTYQNTSDYYKHIMPQNGTIEVTTRKKTYLKIQDQYFAIVRTACPPYSSHAMTIWSIYFSGTFFRVPAWNSVKKSLTVCSLSSLASHTYMHICRLCTSKRSGLVLGRER